MLLHTRIFFLLLACSVASRAAVPTLEYLYPAGGQAGSTFQLSFGGAAEPWPAKAWCDDPAVRFEASTNKGKFDVTIATNAAPGPHLVRIYNSEGSSTPRAF